MLARYAIGALIVLAICGGLYFKGRSDGVDSERGRIAREIEKARKDRTRVEGATRRLDDDALFDRLRDRK